MNVEAANFPQLHTASNSAVAPRILGLSWPLVLGIAAFFIPVCRLWGFQDPDPYWQVRVGEWMLDHHRFLTWDIFSYTMPGAPNPTQEWGSEIVVAVVYRLTGWLGLVLFADAILALTVAYVARCLLRRLEPLYAVTLTCLAGAMLVPMIAPRPHTIVWPLVAVWVATLVEAAEARRSPPWWLLGVMCLWANLHGSFMLGLFLIAPLALEAFMAARRTLSHAQYRKVVERWIIFAAAAVLCTLLNPVGYHALLFPFHMLAMKSLLALLGEWRSPDFGQPQVLTVWLLALLALALSGRLKLPWIRGTLLLGLLYMALQHQRNISLLGLISPFILAGPLAAQSAVSGPDDNVIDRTFRALAQPASWLAVSIGVIVSAVASAIILRDAHLEPARFAPARAVDALLTSGSHGPILNDYNFGGYLIFRGIPVYVDGRGDMYGGKFVSDNFDIMNLARPGFEELLEKQHIQATLLAVDTPAVRLLDHLPGWTRAYADDVAVVHVRRAITASVK
jgi:hypothetical protein